LCDGAAASTWGRRRGRGRWPKGGQEGRGGGGCKTKEGGGGSARVGGKRVGSHPSDRDQWPRPALTSVLPTPAYKSKKVLLLH
jgi:hypothetical protein